MNGSNSNIIRTSAEDGKLVIKLCGRIDTNNAAEAEREIAALLSGAEGSEPVFNAEELEYISSAGLRVLMRVRKQRGKSLSIINASPEVYDIFETTGFTEIFDVSKRMRRIDVDGCEIIGKGYYGTVYRIDEETIVKVYQSPDSLSMIQNEKRLAKTALIAGVPTAISYDIVRVGDSYGSVFELLRAKTLNDLLIEQPDNADGIIRRYAEFMRGVHESEVPAGTLGSAREIFLGYIDRLRGILPQDMYPRLKALLTEIPERNNIVHGDAQMKNIMLADDEPMLIDMDTLCEGHPIFDLQSVYVTYFAFVEHEETNAIDFLGIPTETALMVWERMFGYYFGTEDEKQLSQLRDKITVVGCIRFLFLLCCAFPEKDAYYDVRVETTIRRLGELLERVDTLVF